MGAKLSDKNLFEQVVVAAERYVDSSPSTEFSPLVASAIAAAALREVSELKEQLPGSAKWIMMSCASPDRTSWRAIALAATDQIQSRPVSVMLSEFVTSSINRIVSLDQSERKDREADDDSVIVLRPLELNASASNVPSLPRIDHMYFRASSLQLPDPHPLTGAGWLVGTEGKLDANEEAHVDSCLAQAEQVVADRIFQGLGGYRPIASFLASIDDDFQHSLLMARSASGLSQILESFRAVYSVRAEKSETPVEIEDQQLGDNGINTDQTPNVNRDDLESTVDKRIRDHFGDMPSDAVVKVSPAGDVSCRYGKWHGFVEFGTGFGSLRSQTVLFSVCVSDQAVHRALARYFEIVRQNPKNVELFVLLAGVESSRLHNYLQAWQSTKGVHFGELR